MTLEKQLELEEELVGLGVQRFFNSVTKAMEKGREGETPHGVAIMRVFMQDLTSTIHNFQTSKGYKNSKVRKLLTSLPADVIAFISLKVVLNSLTARLTVNNISRSIGSALEDELRMREIQENNTKYFKSVQKSLQERNSQAYDHKKHVFQKVGRNIGVQQEHWSGLQKIELGAFLLENIRERTGIFKIVKRNVRKGFMYYVTPSDTTQEWVADFNQYASLLQPYTKPCIIPPADWVSTRVGGFHSCRMRSIHRLILGARESVLNYVDSFDISTVLEGVNKLQRTAWQINTPVLDALLYCWEHDIPCGLPSKHPIDIPTSFHESHLQPSDMDEETLKRFKEWKINTHQKHDAEHKRRSKSLSIARLLVTANEYRDKKEFYYVQQLDFRGRAYACTSTLNPQGADAEKAILRFAKGKPITEKGLYWLKVHLANTYGIDKVSFADRVKWVEDNQDTILNTGLNYRDNLNFWTKADKPFQFLAAVFEYTAYSVEPTGFLSHIPVGMDGTCNGLQNFSALLRDAKGGAATNLLPADKPQDIYAVVAKKTQTSIETDTGSDQRTACLNYINKNGGKIPRGLTKRTVMTLPYGCTLFASQQFIQDYLVDTDPEFVNSSNKIISYINKHVWSSVGDTVQAAGNAMKWLQGVAKIIGGLGEPVEWVSPSGMPIFQALYKETQSRVQTILLGDIRLTGNNAGSEIDERKQITSIAPNFVHSNDAAHMCLTTIEAGKKGYELSMIHDDFATHAEDVEDFRQIIKHTFVNMYTDNNPLANMKSSLESKYNIVLPDIPPYGDLNIQEVLNSEYFFS